MMRIKLKPLLALLVCLALFVPLIAGCETNETGGKTQVIRIGTHAQAEDDPYLKNATTGEVDMDPKKQKVSIAALEKVKEELNVEIQFLQYSSDLKQLLLQTVLAGDPYCELAVMWGGSQGNILIQNVLQPLDKYAYIFHDDPDGAWILPQQTFGHYFLMNRDLLFSNTWPIVYNTTMLEEIPGLKEADGTTKYPSEMYYNGEWTWSNFEKYMRTIKEYYAGKTAASGEPIVPFNTNWAYFGQFALHSVGASVYDGEDLGFQSEAAISVCEWVDKLFESELVSCQWSEKGVKADGGWTNSGDAFGRGETVFTNCARWRTDDASMALSERGESMGIIPFPYPDGTNPHTDENSPYRHPTPMADSVGLLRGIDEETSKLALEAYKMYKVEFYKGMAGVDSISEYMDIQATYEAVVFGIDIFHPGNGDDNLRIWSEFGAEPANEYADACGIAGAWNDIFGKAMYGVGGSTKYRTAVVANGASISKKHEEINSAVNSSGAVDTIAPEIKTLDRIALPVGTKPREVDWSLYFEASDNIDGAYPLSRMSLDCTNVDFNTVGAYVDADGTDRRLVAKVTDAAGLSKEVRCNVYIYDPENTTPPTIELKGEELAVDKDALVENVKWNDFIADAKDADGIDLKFAAKAGVTDTFKPGVHADTGWLDVTVSTKANEIGYPVEITVTDFAGNSVTETIYVKVRDK